MTTSTPSDQCVSVDGRRRSTSGPGGGARTPEMPAVCEAKQPLSRRSRPAAKLIHQQVMSYTHRSIYKYLDTGLLSLSIDKMRAPQTHLSCPACITLTNARQPNLSSALLVLPAGLARMRHRENRRDPEFMLGNSGTKLPARCMLGRRGEFEGLANWLPMHPLWLYPVYTMKLARRAGSSSARRASSSSQLHRVNGILTSSSSSCPCLERMAVSTKCFPLAPR